MHKQQLLEQTVARRLKKFQASPPTALGLLCRWASLPLLVILGTAGTTILTLLAQRPGSLITHYWPTAYAAFFFGVICRDIGMARSSAKIWPVQMRFIDWSKVDEALIE